MVMQVARQGEVLQLERPKTVILVLSKEFFNKSGLIVAFPIVRECSIDPLHIPIDTEDYSGIAMIEQL